MNGAFFSLERVLESSSMPPLSEVRNVFATATTEDFAEYTVHLVSHNRKRQFEEFLYYMLLFRDDTVLQKLLNDGEIPVAILEYLVLYSYGYALEKQGNPDRIMDDLLYFLSQERLLALVTDSENISRDYLLVLFILTKMETKYIDIYFGDTGRVKRIIRAFAALPDATVYEIIYRNAFLFDFIMSVMPVYADEATVERYNGRFSAEITRMREINRLVRTYKNREEGWGGPECHDIIERMALLVSILERAGSSRLSLDQYKDAGVFASDTEKLLAYEILANPLYRDTLLKIRQSCFFSDTEALQF
jgi:hypothetical protein